MISNTYGQKFKQLRKERKLTLINTAQGITSKSSLQRWESGKADLHFIEVLELLKKLKIQPIEFLDEPISLRFSKIADEINAAYLKSDINQLKNYTTINLENAHQNIKNHFQFMKACIAANYYNDLTNQNLLSLDDQLRLSSILHSFDNWDYENTFYFCNTLTLLPTEEIYRLSCSLIAHSINEKLYTVKWYNLILTTLLNAIMTLIKTNPTKAKLLLNKFDQMKISDNFSTNKIRRKMAVVLLKYIDTKNYDEITNMISSLEFFNLMNLKDGFITGFNQIKQIYN